MTIDGLLDLIIKHRPEPNAEVVVSNGTGSSNVITGVHMEDGKVCIDSVFMSDAVQA